MIHNFVQIWKTSEWIFSIAAEDPRRQPTSFEATQREGGGGGGFLISLVDGGGGFWPISW